MTTIVTAVEEQAVTTNEIATNVTQASMGINEINGNVATSSQLTNSMAVKNNSTEIRNSAVSLSGLSEKLTEFVARFRIQ